MLVILNLLVAPPTTVETLLPTLAVCDPVAPIGTAVAFVLIIPLLEPKQLLALVAPAADVCPLGQSLQVSSPAPEYVPAVHCIGDVFDVGHLKPAGHCVREPAPEPEK
jgi:hypothetical protein